MPNTHAEVQLPSVPPLSLPSEEQIIIIIIIIIVTIQRPTPVFQAKLKQSETAWGSQMGQNNLKLGKQHDAQSCERLSASCYDCG